MPLKDKIIHFIIPYAMNTKEFDEAKFERELRNIMRYYLARKEFTAAQILAVIDNIDKNLDAAIDDKEMCKKMHNVLRRVKNFSKLYKNLNR